MAVPVGGFETKLNKFNYLGTELLLSLEIKAKVQQTWDAGNPALDAQRNIQRSVATEPRSTAWSVSSSSGAACRTRSRPRSNRC